MEPIHVDPESIADQFDSVPRPEETLSPAAAATRVMERMNLVGHEYDHTPYHPPVLRLHPTEERRVERGTIYVILRPQSRIRRGDQVQVHGRVVNVLDVTRIHSTMATTEKFEILTDDVGEPKLAVADGLRAAILDGDERGAIQDPVERQAIKDLLLQARPEGIDSEFAAHVETVDELGLWMAINGLAATMLTMARDLPALIKAKSPQVHEIGANGMTVQRHVSYAINMTRRFGVTPFEPGESRVSEEYDAWLKWWANFITTMSIDRWGDLQLLIESGQDFSNRRPSGTWKLPPIEDGILPASWLIRRVTPQEALDDGAVWDTAEPREEFLGRLTQFLNDSSSLWFYCSTELEPISPHPVREGYCIVRKRRPFAAITTKTH